LREVRVTSESGRVYQGPHAPLLLGLVVLEEFSKEVAAILLAKSNACLLDL
jgi:hypothetical protein